MPSASRLVCCRLPIAVQALRHYRRALEYSEPSAALAALARAIASSPAWDSVPGAVLMVREDPEPLLAVMGRFDVDQVAWIGVQSQSLGFACERLCYVGYGRAESLCERLAARLVEDLGRDEIRRARFAAIPRGGLVPLGLLATTLGLEREQLEPPFPSDRLLVAVDDCALSGTRFRGFLARNGEARRVVFAHLYSHPELRSAIRSSEPRVVACLSARDLESRDDPERHAARRARYLSHMRAAYWIGDTEPLGFPWGEPDRLIWHPQQQRPAPAWCLVPPEKSLKNRARRSIPIAVQPECPGPTRPAREVVFGELGGRIVLNHLGRGYSAALDGVASDTWLAIVRHGHLSQATEALRLEYPVPARELRRETAEFIAKLIDQGFLETGETAMAGTVCP